MAFFSQNDYLEPENEKSDLNPNSTSYNLLEMTHSCFLVIFALSRTIFVKVVAILSSNFYFGQIFTKSPFLPKTPRKTVEKNFFHHFCYFFSKSIHIWSVLTNFGHQKLFWLRNIAKYLFPQTPIFANFPIPCNNMGKSRKIQMADIS